MKIYLWLLFLILLIAFLSMYRKLKIHNAYEQTKQNSEKENNETKKGKVQFTELEKAIASQRSYVGASFIVFLLYCFLYIPGLIFNILYIKKAQKALKVSGKIPQGAGCLTSLLFIGLIPLIIFVVLFLFMYTPGGN